MPAMAMSTAPAPPVAPAARRSRRGPVALIVLGSLLLVSGVSAFVLGSVLFGSRVADSASGLLDLRAKVLVEVSVPGQAEVSLDGGDYQVVAFGRRLVHRAPGGEGGDRLDELPFVQPTVTVRDPGGSELEVEEPGATSLSRNATGGAVVIGQVTVTDAGRHRVDVEAGGPAVTSVGIRPAPDLEATVDDAIGSGLIVLGGLVAGGLGLLLLVGGIVWFGVRSTTRRPELATPPPTLLE